MSGMLYRPDIDGLRAFAVLPVVAFHLGLPLASGGLAADDVFFVVSVFLITLIIARECRDEGVSIIKFYEQCARRILPVLFVVIATTVLVVGFLFMPSDFQLLARTAGAATAFIVNVLFILEGGHLHAALHTKLLLQSWSLGIEERFCIVVSFVLSVTSIESMPRAAFDLLPWRGGKFGIGSDKTHLSVTGARRPAGLFEPLFATISRHRSSRDASESRTR